MQSAPLWGAFEAGRDIRDGKSVRRESGRTGAIGQACRELLNGGSPKEGASLL